MYTLMRSQNLGLEGYVQRKLPSPLKA